MYVQLSCGHSPYFSDCPPFTGDLIWCLGCDGPSKVTRGTRATDTRMEYWAGCETCRFGRYYGSSDLRALAGARRHQSSKPGHRVIVVCPDGYLLPVNEPSKAQVKDGSH